LTAVVAEIERRRQERLDSENRERDATNEKRHQETTELAKKSIAIGQAAQRTNVWVLRVSIAALVLVFVFGVSQCLDNRHLDSTERESARPAPTNYPQQILSPAPSSQPTEQPATSPTM
jgi:hypothetical protein